MGLERNWASLNVKGFGWLGKILSYRFQYSAKDDNSKFPLPGMVPYAKVKFEVIVLGYRTKIDNSELGIVNSKQFHMSKKNPTYRFCPVQKSSSLDFT